jgi:hypothetical protein
LQYYIKEDIQLCNWNYQICFEHKDNSAALLVEAAAAAAALDP